MPPADTAFSGTAPAGSTHWTRFDTRALALLEEEVAAPETEWSTFNLRVGGALLTDFNTNLRLSVNDTDIGTDVDFEDDLGFQGTTNIFRADASYRFNRRHQVNLSYFDIRRNSGRRLDTEIEWGGEVYPIGVEVESFFNTKVIKGTYQWNFLAHDTWNLGAAIGVHWIGLSTGISLASDTGSVSSSNDFSQGVPFPVLGLHGEWKILPWLAAFGGGDFLWVKLDEVGDFSSIEGYLIDAMIGLQADVLGPLGLGVGYNYFELNAEFGKDRLTLDGDYRYHGVMIFGTLDF